MEPFTSRQYTLYIKVSRSEFTFLFHVSSKSTPNHIVITSLLERFANLSCLPPKPLPAHPSRVAVLQSSTNLLGTRNGMVTMPELKTVIEWYKRFSMPTKSTGSPSSTVSTKLSRKNNAALTLRRSPNLTKLSAREKGVRNQDRPATSLRTATSRRLTQRRSS